MVEFTDLIGQTMTSVENVDDEEIRFTTTNGKQYKLYHEQDCCESVTVEDIVGDLTDLVGSPILLAEESVSNDYPEDCDRIYGTSTWTFYKLATVKGYVDIRWYGSSNGYYSESVDFKEVS
jgi:hypothetical protein